MGSMTMLQHLLRSTHHGSNSTAKSAWHTIRIANAMQHGFSSTSYDYPNRSEPPIISRSKAADLLQADSPTSSSTSIHPAPIAGNDPFDDAHRLSSAQRDKIRSDQRLLNTQLSSPNLSRITAQPPPALVVPQNLSRSSLITPTTHLTTLDNGIRVATQETYGQVSTLGVLAHACGSRLERDPGVNHMMQLLAFAGIQQHPALPDMDAAQFLATMDSLGAVTFASSSLEQFLYCVDVLRPHSKAAFELLSATILHPKMDEAALEEGKRTIEFQWMDHLVSPEVRMEEGIRWAAFSGKKDSQVQQLARPHFCPLEALPLLSMESIQQFRNQHLLNPEFLVVAGAGIEHEQLVSWTHQYFGHLQQPKDTGSSIIPSQYMGGYSRLGLAPSSPMLSTTTHEYPHPHHHASPPLTPPPSPSSTLIPDPFTRVSLSFPTGGWHQTTDLVPACVLQTLLGGGNSFSAGGPGKGMYSRLYREILNRYYWAESAEAFTLFYQEVGLMGMNGSCSTPDKGRDLTHVLADHFIQLLTTPVSDEELYRARNMLKCNVLTQLESRLVLFEDVARQIGTYGKRETAQEMCEKIDAVTKEDIQRVIQTSVRGNRPTLCAMGENLDRVIPALEEVETWFRSI